MFIYLFVELKENRFWVVIGLMLKEWVKGLVWLRFCDVRVKMMVFLVMFLLMDIELGRFVILGWLFKFKIKKISNFLDGYICILKICFNMFFFYLGL